jgi:hypothetical protein
LALLQIAHVDYQRENVLQAVRHSAVGLNADYPEVHVRQTLVTSWHY